MQGCTERSRVEKIVVILLCHTSLSCQSSVKYDVPGGCAAWNRGADYVEYLVPSLRAGTRYST